MDKRQRDQASAPVPSGLLQEQKQLFPLEILSWAPPIRGTAHLKRFAIASDGQEYAVKGITDGESTRVTYPNQIPASEWLCTRLAELCGLPTPACRILLDAETDEYFFGSRIDQAAHPDALKNDQMLALLREADIHFKRQLWAIYAFDMFIYNIDRHINNYLYSPIRSGRVTIQAFDFSLAAFVLGWPVQTGPSLPNDSNTVRNWIIIKRLLGECEHSRNSALDIVDKLELINSAIVRAIFSEMPNSWKHQSLIDALLKWWDGEGKLNQIAALRAEFAE
ncbi:MAG: HipA family kinase [Pseudomonadota bacterium]|uniref:HipA family kinase n=1 Tax=Gallaecimonas pentaromativorans TaxID=584787 RepID=UPI00067EFD23|nr:HipA family kinase [Gallaecimonas pentaromativorans]MED5523449.1 HipA family kinase [Pseudomonadota bacterium]